MLCFDTLLQVLILKGVRSKHNSWTKPAFLLVARCSGAVCGEDGFLLVGDDLGPEKEKAGEGSRRQGADFYTLMIGEGLR